MAVVTPARRSRLELLASYLEGLPVDYSHFGMSYWVLGSDDDKEAKYARHNGGVPSCGTAACAAGHGPAAGVLVPPRFVTQRGGVDWEGYAREVFLGDGPYFVFSWLFSAGWDDEDNSHYGAAARIRYLLANDGPPPGYRYPSEEWVPIYASLRVDAKTSAHA